MPTAQDTDIRRLHRVRTTPGETASGDEASSVRVRRSACRSSPRAESLLPRRNIFCSPTTLDGTHDVTMPEPGRPSPAGRWLSPTAWGPFIVRALANDRSGEAISGTPRPVSFNGRESSCALDAPLPALLTPPPSDSAATRCPGRSTGVPTRRASPSSGPRSMPVSPCWTRQISPPPASVHVSPCLRRRHAHGACGRLRDSTPRPGSRVRGLPGRAVTRVVMPPLRCPVRRSPALCNCRKGKPGSKQSHTEDCSCRSNTRCLSESWCLFGVEPPCVRAGARCRSVVRPCGRARNAGGTP